MSNTDINITMACMYNFFLRPKRQIIFDASSYSSPIIPLSLSCAWITNNIGRKNISVVLHEFDHYNDVIMNAIASQITSLTTVDSTVYSRTGQRKHKSSASLAFVMGINRWPASNAENVFIWWRHYDLSDARKCRVKPQQTHLHSKMPHDDVIKWKHLPRYWPFVRGIHRSLVNSLHKGQWRGALIFSFICVWMNDWVNNREAGDLRRHRGHYDVIVMNNIPLHLTHWGRVTRIHALVN